MFNRNIHKTKFRQVGNLLILLALMVQPLLAQDGDGGTERNLSILGYGARAIGMGKAFTALADDPTAVYWNPAGLEFLYQQSVTLFHTTLWAGTNYEFLGYAYPTLELGTFGFGIARIGVSDIPHTDSDGLEIGRFSNEEYEVFLSYAKKMPFNLTPGVSIRMVRRNWGGLQNEGDLNDTGFGIDLGLMYHPGWLGSPWLQDWAFGLKITNFLAPQLKEGNVIDDIPMTIKLGLMKKIRFAGGESFDVLMDLDFSENRSLRLHLGSGYKIRDIAEVRMGYGYAGLAMGGGVEYKNIQVDYAYSFGGQYSEFLPGVHRVSVSYDFGINRDQMYELAEERRIAEQERIIEELRRQEDQRFVAEHIQIADRYYDQGKYFDAVVEYQQVLSRDRANDYAQMMVDSANSKLQREFQQDRDRALQEALDQSLAEQNQAFVQDHFNRGMAYLDGKKFSEALLEFNVALERDPDNAMLLNAIRTTRRRTVDEAVNLLEQSRVEVENRNFSEALILLTDARVYAENDTSLRRQINEMATTIEIERDIQRGISFFQIKEYTKALEVFDQVLEKDPENKRVQDYQSRAKIEALGVDVKMDEGTEKKYLEGIQYYLRGDYTEAIRIWDEILVEQPYNKKVLRAVAGAREKMEQGSQ